MRTWSPTRKARCGGCSAHLGLPFDPACLRFHETARAVRTPSAEQVRRPLNVDGLDQWRRYAPWLGTAAKRRWATRSIIGEGRRHDHRHRQCHRQARRASRRCSRRASRMSTVRAPRTPASATRCGSTARTRSSSSPSRSRATCRAPGAFRHAGIKRPARRVSRAFGRRSEKMTHLRRDEAPSSARLALQARWLASHSRGLSAA